AAIGSVRGMPAPPVAVELKADERAGMVSGVIGNDALEVAPRTAVISSKIVRGTDHSLADDPIGGRYRQSGELLGARESLARLVYPQAEERAQLVVDIPHPLGETK